MNRLLIVFILAAGVLLASCGSSKDNADRPPHPEPGLAPGSAKIHGTLVGNTDSSVIRVRVHEILGYGSATPPIAVGDTLSISISNKDDQSLVRIQKLSTFISVIRHHEAPNTGDHVARVSWTMQNITKEQ